MTERYLAELKEMNTMLKYFDFINTSITTDYDKIHTFIKRFTDDYNLTKINKDFGSFCTSADLASENFFKKKIAKFYPKDQF